MCTYRLEFDSNLGWLELLVSLQDISSGTAPTLFVITAARLFRQAPHLPVASEQQKNELSAAVRTKEQLEESSTESRSYSRWIGSLLGVNMKDLFSEISSGVILLQLLELVQPGCVDWKQGHKRPKGSFKCIENCCLAVTVGKQIGLKLVGIDGRDLYDGVPKLVHSFLDQLRRTHQATMLTALSGGQQKVLYALVSGMC